LLQRVPILIVGFVIAITLVVFGLLDEVVLFVLLQEEKDLESALDHKYTVLVFLEP
jgi:protein-S-isoprenylcysteine O-methyltransferase Ste14